MGQKLVPREVDPYLHDLGRWMDFRGVTYADLAEVWGRTRTPVYERLSGKQDVGFRELRKALKMVGVSLKDFVHGVRTGFHPELLLADIEAENRDQVKSFRRIHLLKPPKQAYSAVDLHEIAAGLETLRFRQPEKAWRMAREILRTPNLEPDVAAEAWGILAVLSRFKGRPSITAFCLAQALRIGGSLPTQGQTWQRIAMLLLVYVTDANLAFEAIQKARACYWRAGDPAGVGKTLVDEGVILVNAIGDYRQAIAVYETALELLPKNSTANRFCALQGLAVANVYQGDVRQATERLDQALAVAGEHPTHYLASGVLWLKGELALLLGRSEEAGRLFRIVRDRYVDLEMGPVEIALVSLRIAKVCFLLADTKRLRSVLEDMLLRQGDIEVSNKALSAVLAEFLRNAMRGRLSSELFEEIYREIHRGTEAAPPLLPTNLPHIS